MILANEILKIGSADRVIVDLDIKQVESNKVEISSGPVIYKGVDCSFNEPTLFNVDIEPNDKWVAIYIVQKMSDDKIGLFLDEGFRGEMSYDFSKSREYVPVLKLGEIQVPGGSTNLDDASLVMRRVVSKERWEELNA